MIKKPKFWDKKQLNFLSILLLPLTFIIIVRNIINKLIKKKKFQKKSICIGNIYLGGTGKTPLTIKLNQILSNLNFNIGIVKKYYPNQKDEQDLLGKNNNLIVVNRRIDSFKIAKEQNLIFCYLMMAYKIEILTMTLNLFVSKPLNGLVMDN